MNNSSKVLRIVSLVIAAWVVSGVVWAEDVDGGFMYDGIHRTYILHVPPQHNGQDSLPLVVNMHGYSSSAELQAWYSRMSTNADVEGFLVVYPNGVGVEQSWNAGTCCGTAMEYNVDDVGFISALIDTIQANYVVDTLRVYATGMSNGGMMSHRLACELSGKIAAAGPVAGGLMLEDWDECQPQRPVPIIHFHARDDGAVHYDGGYTGGIYMPPMDSVMQFWADRNGCDVGPDTFYQNDTAFSQTWSQTEGDVEVVFWTTEDGGHSWPGSIDGSEAISANDLMWEFFLAHPMPVEPDPGTEEPIASPTFELNPVYPNPFAVSTTIRFSLGQAEHVTLKLFDALGREIATLLEGSLEAGEHTVVVDAVGLSAGVYFYRLATPTFTMTRSIKLVK